LCLRRFSLEDLHAHSLLVFGHGTVDAAGSRWELRVLWNENVIHAVALLFDLDSQAVRVDVDLNYLPKVFAHVRLQEQAVFGVASSADASMNGGPARDDLADSQGLFGLLAAQV